jgi:zinc-ribbon domain
MAKFCDKCGTSLSDSSAFCISCGAPSAPKLSSPPPTPVAVPYPDAAPTPAFQSVQTPAYQPPPQQPYIPPPQTPPQQAYVPPPQPQPPAYAPPQPAAPPQWSAPQPAAAGYPPAAQAAQTAKSSNTILKVILGVVVVLGICAVAVVGGLWYVGHKVVGKVKDAANQAGLDTNDLGRKGTPLTGDPCRFLSKSEVGDAIGVPITETKSTEDSCSYLAQGTMSDMTSKHMAAMLGQRGADKKSQEMVQQFAGIIGSAQPKSAGEDSDASGNAVVLTVSFQTESARAQMKLDSKVLGAFGQAGGSSTLTGIGDEASVAADGMMMVRKGDTLIRFMYTSCPCSTEAIKPLAKKVANAL